jgi:molecular chaperone HtpG
VEASFSKESYKEFLKKFPQAATALTPYIRQQEEQSLIDILELPEELRTELGPQALEELHNHAYTELKIDVKSLKTKDIPGVIVFSEFMRRWHDMDMVSRMGGSSDMLKHHTLVVNPENGIIQKLIEMDKAGKAEEVDVLCGYIHDLSLLEQKPFSGDELKGFIAKANKVLSYLA